MQAGSTVNLAEDTTACTDNCLACCFVSGRAERVVRCPVDETLIPACVRHRPSSQLLQVIKISKCGDKTVGEIPNFFLFASCLLVASPPNFLQIVNKCDMQPHHQTRGMKRQDTRIKFVLGRGVVIPQYFSILVCLACI